MDKKSDSVKPKPQQSPSYSQPLYLSDSYDDDFSTGNTVDTMSNNRQSKKDKSKPKKKKEFQFEEISTTVGPTTSSPQTSSSEDDDTDNTTYKTTNSDRLRSRERSSTIASDNFQSSNYKFNPFIDKPSYCFLTPRDASPITSPGATYGRNIGTLNGKMNSIISVPNQQGPRAQSLRSKAYNRPGIPDFTNFKGPEPGSDADMLRRTRSNSSSLVKPKSSGCFVTLDVSSNSNNNSNANTGTTSPTTATKKGLKLNLTEILPDGEQCNNSIQTVTDSENITKISSKATLSPPSLPLMLNGATPVTVATTDKRSGSSSSAIGTPSSTTVTLSKTLTVSGSAAATTTTVTTKTGEKQKKTKKSSKKSKKKSKREEEDKEAAEWDKLIETLDARADPMKHVKIWGKALFHIETPPFSSPKLPKEGFSFTKTICRVVFKRKRSFSSSGKMVSVGFIERMEEDGSFVKLVDLGPGITKIMQSWDQKNNVFALVVCTESSSYIIETLPRDSSKDWFSTVERIYKKIVK